MFRLEYTNIKFSGKKQIYISLNLQKQGLIYSSFKKIVTLSQYKRKQTCTICQKVLYVVAKLLKLLSISLHIF